MTLEELKVLERTGHVNDDDLLVSCKDLRVGDIIVAQVSRENIYGRPLVVVSLAEGVHIEYYSEGWHGLPATIAKTSFLTSNSSYWIRARGPAKDMSKFPHTCPYCKAKCYHGSYRIEHAVEPANCYAR